MVIDQSQADMMIQLLTEINMYLQYLLALGVTWSAVVLIKYVLFGVLDAFF